MENEGHFPAPADWLALQADRLLAQLDDGTIDPAAVALADALDAYLTVLPDQPAIANRFELAAGIFNDGVDDPVGLAEALFMACRSVEAERGNADADPAVRIILLQLVQAIKPLCSESQVVTALNACLDRRHDRR
jgi:hypothetical protein